MYSVKEIFYTLQGEGANAGRPAVFCRFSGCNLWSGHEKDRSEAICKFCDTDFVGVGGSGGGRFDSAKKLATAARSHWPNGSNGRGRPFLVCTGGEPLLQVDEPLIREFHECGFEIAVETNGTVPVPEGIDWTTVSPKAGAQLLVRTGDELKLVFPQAGTEPELYQHLCFERFFLQPMDGPGLKENTNAAISYCMRHPQWRLSLQTHKILGLP